MRSALSRVGNRVIPRLATPTLLKASRTAERVSARLFREGEERRIDALTNEDWLQWAYETVFHRDPDPIGRETWLNELRRGMPRADLLRILSDSAEAESGDTPRMAMEAFHGSRVTWTQSLPSARRIIDLGGTALGSELGSLIMLGYPYTFDALTIVELPSEDRHDLYKVGDNSPEISSPQGPIRYLYQSMVELGNVADQSMDLVVSGQTFEHISEADGKTLLAHAARILAPGGHLALDTPNRAITEIQCAETGEEFINPDHQVEYTHPQMIDLFDQAGLEVVRAHGIGYMPQTARTKQWLIEELITNKGLYDAIEDSYTLAYLARPVRR